MQCGVVIGSDCGGETALSIPGVAFAKRAFGDDRDVNVFRQAQGK